MPPHLSARDPRHALYKWKRMIPKPWKELDPHRVRRCDHLASRLHNALGAAWDVRRDEASYGIAPRGQAVDAAKMALWKNAELVVGFRADQPGAYEAAAELSPQVIGCWSDDPAQRFFCAVVPDEGQEDEILLAVHDHFQAHLSPH